MLKLLQGTEFLPYLKQKRSLNKRFCSSIVAQLVSALVLATFPFNRFVIFTMLCNKTRYEKYLLELTKKQAEY